MIRCGVEEPLVSERVLQLADSPVWLILEGLEHRRSGRNRPFEERVNVVHVDVDDDGTSGIRRQASHVRLRFRSPRARSFPPRVSAQKPPLLRMLLRRTQVHSQHHGQPRLAPPDS